MADARTERLNAARTKPGSHAGPHGSFPITDEKSVNSAIRLAGHADDPAAVRARVEKLAEEKGLTAGLPKSVTKGEHRHGLTRMVKGGA